MVCILIVVVLTQMYVFTETHEIVLLKWLHFIVYEFYSDRGNFFKKRFSYFLQSLKSHLVHGFVCLWTNLLS